MSFYNKTWASFRRVSKLHLAYSDYLQTIAWTLIPDIFLLSGEVCGSTMSKSRLSSVVSEKNRWLTTLSFNQYALNVFFCQRKIAEDDQSKLRTNNTEKKIYTWCYRKPYLISLPPCKVSNPTLLISMFLIIIYCHQLTLACTLKQNFTFTTKKLQPALTFSVCCCLSYR